VREVLGGDRSCISFFFFSFFFFFVFFASTWFFLLGWADGWTGCIWFYVYLGISPITHERKDCMEPDRVVEHGWVCMRGPLAT